MRPLGTVLDEAIREERKLGGRLAAFDIKEVISAINAAVSHVTREIEADRDSFLKL